jgi:sensor histidine kinase regulating citrate/malate metabolism
MFPTLLVVTFLVALTVSIVVAAVFAKPIKRILNRIIPDEISSAWSRYLTFAILVVGVSAGVRIYDLEKYITPLRNDKDAKIIELTNDRWVLELYRTVIETLHGIAWMLLVFFLVALVAYVIVRASELKRHREHEAPKP